MRAGAQRGVKAVEMRKHMVQFSSCFQETGAGVRRAPPPPHPLCHLQGMKTLFYWLLCLSVGAGRCLCDGTWQEVKCQPLGFPLVSAWVESAATSRRARRLDRSTCESDTIAPAPTAVVRGLAGEEKKEKKRSLCHYVM